MIDYLALYKVPRALTVRVHVKQTGGSGLLLNIEASSSTTWHYFTHSDHIDGRCEKQRIGQTS